LKFNALNQAAEPGLLKPPQSLCEEPVQPLFGSRRPISAPIQLQTSPSSPASRHRGARVLGGLEGDGTPRQSHAPLGSSSISPRSWESGASLGWRCWMENHLQLQNPPPPPFPHGFLR